MNALELLVGNPLAHQLGWVLFHSLWEGALAAVAFAIVRRGLRSRTANLRYIFACVTLLLIIVAPVVSAWSTSGKLWSGKGLPARPAAIPFKRENVFSTVKAVFSQRSVTATIGFGYFREANQWLDGSLPWIVPVWFCGVLAFSFRWLQGSHWLRHIKANDVTPLETEWVLRLTELQTRLGILRPVRLLKSALIEVPMVVGWLKPVILLPASALSGLTPRELEAILAHELAHVRRCDYLVNVFQNLVETLMFYHPAVWWVSQCIREERELCCDDMVVRLGSDRLVYARALVTLEEFRANPRLAFAATGGSLLNRVRRLLGVGAESGPPSTGELSGIALIAFGCLLVVMSVWLLNHPSGYRSSALIKVIPARSVVRDDGETGSSTGDFYPYFLQTECLVMRSPAVLELAINALDSTKKNNGTTTKLSRPEYLTQLRSQLSFIPVPNSSVIEIQATTSDPEEPARIANAVAAAYKQHRVSRHLDSASSSLSALEARWDAQAEKIRKAQQRVDQLRVDLRISEAMPEATPSLSAETLRRIEALRIESQAEYMKQKSLLKELEKQEPNDLPASLLAAGVQDNQLASLSESLALVETKLVSLQKELGPEHTEVVKAAAQQQDLRQKIRARTSGIFMGLQAKVESMGEGLASLSNEVARAQESDIEQANKSRPYFDAKRDLEELIRFRQALQTRIAIERTDLLLPWTGVEILEEAIPAGSAIAPNRSRALGLFAAGLVLALSGLFLARLGRLGLAVAHAT